MKIRFLLILVCCAAGLTSAARAVTTVNAGSINAVTGPGSLDFSNNLYAVRFNGPALAVNGVTFVSDTTPPVGFSSVGPQLVTDWQTKPEFGGTANDNNLEEIYSDIRWTNQGPDGAGGDPNLQANMAVVPGQMYRLQVLFYANHALETRGWDILVDGIGTVDNISSHGVVTGAGFPAYSPNMGLVYTYDFIAPDGTVNVAFGHGNLIGPGGAGEFADDNAIWSGIMLSAIPEPSTALLGGVAALALLRRRRAAS